MEYLLFGEPVYFFEELEELGFESKDIEGKNVWLVRPPDVKYEKWLGKGLTPVRIEHIDEDEPDKVTFETETGRSIVLDSSYFANLLAVKPLKPYEKTAPERCREVEQKMKKLGFSAFIKDGFIEFKGHGLYFKHQKLPPFASTRKLEHLERIFHKAQRALNVTI
jgi:hypothetical protein